MSRGAMPTFFVIGAAKAGTTSLHSYLDLHPEIGMSTVKEPGYFAGPENGRPYPKGRISRREDYEALFDPAFAVRGESSPNYACAPIRSGVPERIASVVPGAKIVYLVRDPVARTVSHHAHRVALGDQRAGLTEALRRLDAPEELPETCMSLYGAQLEPYLRRFGEERVMVLDQAELLAARGDVMRELFGFLGVDAGFASPEFAREHYRARDRRRYPPGYERLVGSTLAPHLRWMPEGLRRRARGTAERLVFRKLVPPQLDRELRERLRALYRPDVERLRSLTGKGFSSWSV
jgi:hypothetical protein